MSQDNDNGDVKISMAKANRKIAKPIMEKKRRARINASLNELKTLLVEVLQKEGCRHSSKMEKADILEMAVRHLKNLQKQQNFPGSHTPSLRDSYPPAIPVEKYASSFSPDCLSPELKRFFVRSPTDTKSATDPTSPDSTVTSQPMVKLDCNRNIVAAPLPINTNSNTLPINTTISGMSTAALPGNSNTITQPMMTRTATGEIAVVLPQHLLKQAAASQPNAGGLILPIYTLPQNATQLGVDTKVPISPLGSPQQQPVMISINMPTLQQSQCSAFTSLPSSSSTTSSSQSSLQSPISPVWRPW